MIQIAVRLIINGQNGWGSMPNYNEWWYPGHMAKAIRQLEDELPKIDVLVELVDARLPLHTRIPNLSLRFANKPIVLILTKTDLADAKITEQWITYFRAQGLTALSLTSLRLDRALLQKTIRYVMKEKHDKWKAKGIRPRPTRVVVVGMPNIGKSTFINQWIQRKVAKVENRPGVTRNLQWIRIGEDVELLDMPGIVFPQEVSNELLQKLAFIGVSPHHSGVDIELGRAFTQYLYNHHLNRVALAYEMESKGVTDGLALTTLIAKKRGYIAGDTVDEARTYEVMLTDFRNGKFGRLSLESPLDGN